jgi:mannose-6-phosphate isomerase-like protein (cupin superfamily)
LRVILERMPAHTAEARHYHRSVRPFFVIPSGRARFELGNAVFSRHAVYGVEVPSGALRRIRNEGADDLEFLVVSLPHSHRDRLTLEEYV